MAEELTPDICVIGGGPGGIAAALAAAGAGVSVVLIEKDRTGGNNLTSGTVPSKALLAAASVYEALRAGPGFGVTGAPLQVNLGKVRDHIVEATEAIARNVSPERLTAQGIKVIAGAARFANSELVVVDTTAIRARNIVLAVGSVPAVPDFPGLDAVESMTLAQGFDLSRKPAHLLVLGANRYALEFAQACARLGIDATVIDDAPALPDDDPELAAIVVDGLRAEGTRVRAGVKIQSVARRRSGIRITVGDPKDGTINIDGSHILVATGRMPDVEGLGLAAAGIAYDLSGIIVDDGLRTSNRRVFAIGDAVAGPALAVRAEQQGVAVVSAILRRKRVRDDPTLVPAVAFTDPALASVGLIEAEARRLYRDIRILRFPFIENDRAHIERQPDGMIKVVTTVRGRIVGASIVGRDAAELIAPWSLAVASRLGVDAMRAFLPAYPTRSAISHRVLEGFGETAPVGRHLTPQWSRRIIEFFRKFG